MYLKEYQEKVTQVKKELLEDKIDDKILEPSTEFYQKICISRGKNLIRYLSAFGKEIKQSDYIIATGINLFTQAGRIVDDIADKDQKREGTPTFHRLIEKRTDLSSEESVSIALHLAYLLEHHTQKIFMKNDLFKIYERIKIDILEAQIAEETEQKIYNTDKNLTAALPLITAGEITNTRIEDELIQRLLLHNQKINDIFDLFTKKSDQKKGKKTFINKLLGDKPDERQLTKEEIKKIVNTIDKLDKEFIQIMNLLKEKAQNPERIQERIKAKREYTKKLLRKVKKYKEKNL